MSAALSIDIRFPLDARELVAKAEFPIGKISALSGPSGKGKTSLLLALAGLQPGVTGGINAEGRSWSGLPPHERNIGFAFQDDRLFQHMSIAENLAWVAKRRPAALDSGGQQAILSALDLDSVQDRKTAVLSGGERRRASVARALVQNPDWLFLDEPFAGLDEERAAALAGLLDQRMAARKAEGRPLSIIFVSHDGRDIARLADHVFCLDDAGLSEQRPEDVPDHTALRGRVTIIDQEYALTQIEAGGQIWHIAGLHGPVGRDIGLTIDARDVALSGHRPDDISVRNVLEGTITGIVAGQTAPWALVCLEAGDLVLQARITRKSVDEMGLVAGKTVFALVKSVALDHLI